ncbi:MAG: hypothetical protein SYR96_29635, partial [Actinomycetota bacterium]|nr:hypothetical protein [Actinomycetota bacterium]
MIDLVGPHPDREDVRAARRRLEEAVPELHPAALEKLGDMSDTTLRTAGRTVRARRRPSQHTRPRG